MLNKSNGKFTGNNQAGSSMIEVVISILILTVGLVGAAAAITYALEIGFGQPQCHECKVGYRRIH